MKLIKQSFEIIPQENTLEGLYKHIEKCARTCYKSEDKITEDSAKTFVDRLIKSQHCYTGDSEVLTNLGWIKWKEYNSEKIAVVNLDGSFKGFETPKTVISKEYSGRFYEYCTLGLKVTEGHRMFGMFANSDKDRYKKFEGQIFTCNTPYEDANRRKKTLGERWFKTQCVCNFDSKLNPYYQLIGFWLGDGCRNDSKNTLTFHIKKDRKVKYLSSICLQLKYKFKYTRNYFTITKNEIGSYFNSNFVLNSEKHISLDYTEDLCEIYSIIDGLLNSDGSFQKTGISFTSTSQSLMNYIYSKGPLVGYNVSVGTWKKTSANGYKQVERLFILKSNNKIVNDSRKLNSKVVISNEALNVYCVTVSTGLILVRGTNGVISICGNCAMLEHATVYLKFDSVVHGFCSGHGAGLKYMNNPYSKVNIIEGTTIQCVTTNYRVLVENNWLDDLQYLCNPTEHHHKRTTVKLVTDQGILREFTRHRKFSFAVESTRYCNYSRDKHNNEITFIIPSWSKLEEGQCSYDETTSFIRKCKNKMPLSDIAFLETCAFIESKYLMMTMFYENTAQEARNILPLATKCDMIMTGFVDDWKHLFRLRTSFIAETGKPHPGMSNLCDPLYNEFVNTGIMESLV